MRTFALAALAVTIIAFVGCSTQPTSRVSPPAATALTDLGTVAVNDGGWYQCPLGAGRDCRIRLTALAEHRVLVEVVVLRKDAQGDVRILAQPHTIANVGQKVRLEIDGGSVALVPEVKLATK